MKYTIEVDGSELTVKSRGENNICLYLGDCEKACAEAITLTRLEALEVVWWVVRMTGLYEDEKGDAYRKLSDDVCFLLESMVDLDKA